MAGTVYSRQIATAQRIIKAKGAKCTWRQRPDVADDDDKPWNAEERPPVDKPVSIAFFPDGQKTFAALMKGEDAPEGVEIGYMGAVDFEPAVGDTVIRNGVGLRVASVTPLQPDGTPILYTIGIET